MKSIKSASIFIFVFAVSDFDEKSFFFKLNEKKSFLKIKIFAIFF